MKPRIVSLNSFGKLCKAGQQHPDAGIHMNKESRSPMNNVNVLLFYPQKTHVSVIGDIIHRYPGHQPGKKSQCGQEACIPDICANNNLCYFYLINNNGFRSQI